MKISTIVIGCLLLYGGILFAGEPKIIYEVGDEISSTFYHSEQGQNIELGEAEGRPLLWLEYNRQEAPWFDMAFRVKDRSNAVGPFTKAKFISEIYVPEEACASWFNMRIVDKDGEVAQLCSKITPEMRGWVTVSVEFTAEKPGSTWGGKTSNKKIDFPAKVNELTIDFSNKLGTGRIGIGRIMIEED